MFRDRRKRIEEALLKHLGIKLGKGRKRDGTIKARTAYNQGVIDSKKIDVRRRKYLNATASEEETAD